MVNTIAGLFKEFDLGFNPSELDLDTDEKIGQQVADHLESVVLNLDAANKIFINQGFDNVHIAHLLETVATYMYAKEKGTLEGEVLKPADVFAEYVLPALRESNPIEVEVIKEEEDERDS